MRNVVVIKKYSLLFLVVFLTSCASRDEFITDLGYAVNTKVSNPIIIRSKTLQHSHQQQGSLIPAGSILVNIPGETIDIIEESKKIVNADNVNDAEEFIYGDIIHSEYAAQLQSVLQKQNITSSFVAYKSGGIRDDEPGSIKIFLLIENLQTSFESGASIQIKITASREGTEDLVRQYKEAGGYLNACATCVPGDVMYRKINKNFIKDFSEWLSQ